MFYVIQKKYSFKPIIAVAIVGFVFLISWISNYNLISPYPVNFDIATMLTPSGIFKNYIFNDTYLTPYYDQSPQIADAGSKGLLYFLIFTLDVLVVLLLCKFRKSDFGNPQRQGHI